MANAEWRTARGSDSLCAAGAGAIRRLNHSTLPVPDGSDDTLHYDGANATGLGMSGGGWFKAGVRFTTPFRCLLKSILFYQYDLALSGYVFLYGSGTDTTPGSLWDSLLYIPEGPGTWNRVDLPEARFLGPDTDFWAAPEFACGPDRYPMGLDSGPLVWNRNFIYWTSSLGWVHLDRIGTFRNWNLRAIISRADPHDIGPTLVVSPQGQTWPRPLSPRVQVRNFGEYPESGISVYCWIDSAGIRVYDQSALLPGPIPPGDHAVASLPVWNPGPAGIEYSVTAFTRLPGDENQRNDTIHGRTRIATAAFSDTIVVRLVSGSPPVVDGVVETGEWAGAEVYDVSDTAGQGLIRQPPGSSIVRFLHDASFLYLACELPPVHERLESDHFALCMDEDHSGTWARQESSEGRHSVAYSGGDDSLVFDAILTNLPYMWRMPGQCPDAVSASSTTGGCLQFEARIPFGTRRGDLGLSPADTAGVFLYSMAESGSSFYGWWPQHVTSGNWANPALYGPLILCPDVGVTAGAHPVQFGSLLVSPNPATRLTRISLTAPDRSPAALAVYDATGTLVRVLRNSGNSAKGKTFVWDCRSESGQPVPSGVYFAKPLGAPGIRPALVRVVN